MKIIVTGSHRWILRGAVFRALTSAYLTGGPFDLRHGACSTGADHHAHEWFELVGKILGCTETRYPANWERGREAGPERDRRMVEAGADLVLAFPLPGGSGTQHTMRLAREAGIEVVEYKAD